MRIGFAGLGSMGQPMVRRLVGAGCDVTVWNRTPSRAAGLGAAIAATPRDLAAGCDLVALCLLDGAAVREVVFGPDGILAGASPGTLLVDFSTIAPDDARAMAAESGLAWIDAPVSGGVPGAEAGSLIVFAGGEADAIARAAPLFDAVSRRVTHMGPVGAGQTTKLLNQLIVAVNVLTIAETVALGRRAGVDVAALPAALAGGFADSTPLQIFGPRMAARNFATRQSAIGLMAKDIGMVQVLARHHAAATPVSALVSALYETIRQRPDFSFSADVAELVRVFEPDPAA